MSAKKMTKEQKQRAILGGLLLCFLVAGGWQFLLLPMQTAYDENLKKRDDLREDLRKAQLLVRAGVQDEKKNIQRRADLQSTLTRQIPPIDNALSWASQLIYGHSRKLGLQVTSISEVTGIATGWQDPGLAKRILVPYAVRVELACSYEMVRNLARAMQEDSPYLNVHTITLTAEKNNVQSIGVQMILEWPSWRDATAAQQAWGSSNAPQNESGRGTK